MKREFGDHTSDGSVYGFPSEPSVLIRVPSVEPAGRIAMLKLSMYARSLPSGDGRVGSTDAAPRPPPPPRPPRPPPAPAAPAVSAAVPGRRSSVAASTTTIAVPPPVTDFLY